LNRWEFRPVLFKYQLSDWTLASCSLPLQVTSIPFGECELSQLPDVPALPLEPGSQGFSVRSLPLSSPQPVFRSIGNYLCYVQQTYDRFYIDLSIGFEAYKQKFSSKSRSTILRKVKNYRQHCGGDIEWKVYATLEEIEAFFHLARRVSAKTYQERLLDAGLPDTAAYLGEMKELAVRNEARGFILFDKAEPVSYLYCPVRDGALVYAYLGYDPAYIKLSVGTVLHWLALENLFAERHFKFFDFTEGQSEHKRLFATHSISCANVVFLLRSIRNWLVVLSHYGFGRLSTGLGALLDRWGLKARVRRIMRFRS
jgi:hypothetical protein